MPQGSWFAVWRWPRWMMMVLVVVSAASALLNAVLVRRAFHRDPSPLPIPYYAESIEGPLYPSTELTDERGMKRQLNQFSYPRD